MFSVPSIPRDMGKDAGGFLEYGAPFPHRYIDTVFSIKSLQIDFKYVRML